VIIYISYGCSHRNFEKVEVGKVDHDEIALLLLAVADNV
jgi:hypothetical protein